MTACLTESLWLTRSCAILFWKYLHHVIPILNKEFLPFLTRWKRWSKLLFVKANFLQFPCFGQKRTFKHITYYTIIERVVITVLKVSSPVSEFQLKAALVPLSTLILVARPGNNSILGLAQYSNKAFKVEVISKVRDIQCKEYIGWSPSWVTWTMFLLESGLWRLRSLNLAFDL